MNLGRRAPNLGRHAPAAKTVRRAAARNANEDTLALVELVPSLRPTQTGCVVVQLGGVRIEVGPDFAPVTLQRLLAVLCTC